MRSLVTCEKCDSFLGEKFEKSMWHRCKRTSEGFRKEKEYSKATLPTTCPYAKKHEKELNK